MRAACIKLVAVFVLALTPLAAHAQQLADHVPNDALLFVSWQGADKMQPAYQGSHLKAVLDASSIPEFVQARLPAFLERLAGRDEEGVAVQKQAWQIAALMGKYPSALYVGPPEPNGPPMPRIAILCDAGKDSEALAKTAQDLLDKAGRPPVEIDLQRKKGMVVLMIGRFTIGDQATLLAQALDGTTPLAADKAFVAAMAQVNKDPVLTVYVNVPAVLKVADRVAGMDHDASEIWPKMRDALNLAGVREAVFTAGFDGKDWSQQAFIAAAGPRTGILTLLDGAPITNDQLKLIPVSATWAAAFRTDLGKLWSETLAGIAKTSPEAAQQTQSALAAAAAELGIDIEKDLIAPLGDQWVAYTAASVGGNGLTGIVAVNTLKDAARLAKSLDILEAKANAAMDESTRRGPRPPFEPKFAIRRTTIAGVEVHHIGVIWINPSWAIHNGKLYIALMPQAIPAAIDAAAAKTSILDNDAFVAMRKRLGVDKPTSLNFIDLPKTAPDSYPLLSMVVGLAGMFVGADAPPALLPPLHKLLPELAPAGAATWTDAAGWHMKSVSPFPGSIVLSGQQSVMSGGVAMPALAVAVFLPAVGPARATAVRTAEMANLRSATMGCHIFAADHGGTFPDHLAQLIAEGILPPTVLVSASSGTKPAELTKEQLAAAKEDWHAIEKIIDEHCDYVYLGKGLAGKGDFDAQNTIVAYAKPHLPTAREGLNCTYYDGHCEWIRRADLVASFAVTNRLRKKMGLAEIEFQAAPAPRAPATHP